MVPSHLVIKSIFNVMNAQYKKQKIPKAIREQLWIQKVGRRFETKCKTTWCRNKINVFDFQAGHDIPESKGGETCIANLIPICGRCNLSMGNQFTFRDWCKKGNKPSKWNEFVRGVLQVWNSLDTKEHTTKSTPNRMSPKDKPRK
jgi:HNH endonuclease